MSGSDGRWAELSSKNERVVRQDDPAAVSAGGPSGTGLTRWAALASQRERLVDVSDPDFRPSESGRAGTGHAGSGHAGARMRLVAGAA